MTASRLLGRLLSPMRPLARHGGAPTRQLGMIARSGVAWMRTPTMMPTTCAACSRMQMQQPAGLHRALSSAAGSDDYYGMLGLPKNASKSEVKKAYYKLAKKYHPDTNSGDPAAAKKFAELTEAYEVLSDEQKRARYDAYGKAGLNDQGGGGGGHPFGGFGGQSSQMGPEDIFRSRPLMDRTNACVRGCMRARTPSMRICITMHARCLAGLSRRPSAATCSLVAGGAGRRAGATCRWASASTSSKLQRAARRRSPGDRPPREPVRWYHTSDRTHHPWAPRDPPAHQPCVFCVIAAWQDVTIPPHMHMPMPMPMPMPMHMPIHRT